MINGTIRMGKISNVTNSSDPHAINSRIFVGNLNTFTLTKDDVECIFKRYGRIIGISMHKGYAFVQYTSEVDSRNAVAGEDQRIYATQPIDVNMASEPKPNRPSRKRPQGAGAEWDYYYNAPLLPRGVLPPPLKKPRTEGIAIPAGLKVPPGMTILPAGLKRTLVPLGGTANLLAKHNMLIASKPRFKNRGDSLDILICGSCKQMFPNLERLSEHKQVKCKLRVVTTLAAKTSGKEEPVSVVCATCQAEYCSSWDLIVHVQQEHHLTIYVDSTKTTNNNATTDNGETQSDAGSSRAGDLSDSENKPNESGSDVAEMENEGVEGLPDGVVMVHGEEEAEVEDQTELNQVHLDDVLEQSIIQQAINAGQQPQTAPVVGNGN